MQRIELAEALVKLAESAQDAAAISRSLDKLTRIPPGWLEREKNALMLFEDRVLDAMVLVESINPSSPLAPVAVVTPKGDKA